MWSVLAERPVPEPRLDGLKIGLLRKPPYVGGTYVPEATDLAEQWVADLERLGARVVEAEIPPPEADTWPMFEHEAAVSHRETFPSRADDYGYTIRPKLERAQDVKAEDVEAAYAAVHAWRRYEPPVDLYVAPCVTGELPRRGRRRARRALSPLRPSCAGSTSWAGRRWPSATSS